MGDCWVKGQCAWPPVSGRPCVQPIIYPLIINILTTAHCRVSTAPPHTVSSPSSCLLSVCVLSDPVKWYQSDRVASSKQEATEIAVKLSSLQHCFAATFWLCKQSILSSISAFGTGIDVVYNFPVESFFKFCLEFEISVAATVCGS